MSVEPEFLSVENVLLLHDDQLRRHGGSAGIRDRGGLESEVAMAQASFGGEWVHADLYAMAAAYAFHIAESQAFVDGNKRAALAAALVFLEINGVTIVDPEGVLYPAMIAFATKKLNKKGFGRVLRILHENRGAFP